MYNRSYRHSVFPLCNQKVTPEVTEQAKEAVKTLLAQQPKGKTFVIPRVKTFLIEAKTKNLDHFNEIYVVKASLVLWITHTTRSGQRARGERWKNRSSYTLNACYNGNHRLQELQSEVHAEINPHYHPEKILEATSEEKDGKVTVTCKVSRVGPDVDSQTYTFEFDKAKA